MIVDMLPEWLAMYLPAVSLLVAGKVVEKHYVSRMTTFTNSMALVVFGLTHEVGWIMGLYIDIGVLAGLVGLYAYSKSESLSEDYYYLSGLLYSSAVVGTILLFPFIEGLLALALPSPNLFATGVVCLVALVNAVFLDEDDSLIYRGARPFVVNEFIYYSWIPGRNQKLYLDEWFDIK